MEGSQVIPSIAGFATLLQRRIADRSPCTVTHPQGPARRSNGIDRKAELAVGWLLELEQLRPWTMARRIEHAGISLGGFFSALVF